MVESNVLKKPENSTANRYRTFSNQQLVNFCLINDRKAWEEFFFRFIPVLKRSIQRKLTENGLGHLIHDREVLGDIHEEITIKLYKNGILAHCKDTKGLIPWLGTIAQNQTVDWIKKKNRIKRLPQQQSELNTVSFSDPLNGKSHLSIGDTIIDDSSKDLTALRHDLEDSLNRIADIRDEQKYWIFRLSIIAPFPLSNDEFKELSKFCSLPLEQLKERIDVINKELEKKETKRIESMNNAVLYWHIINRLKTNLNLKKEKLDSICNLNINDNIEAHDKIKIQDLKKQIQDSIKTIETQIEEKSQKREGLLKHGRKLCRPSNSDIAALVGIPIDNAVQVSNILIRIRKKITKDDVGK